MEIKTIVFIPTLQPILRKQITIEKRMEENKKFYSKRAISITTFFGGPLAAGILMRQNYLNNDKEKQGKNALFIGIVSTVIIFGGLLALPENIIDKIPSALIPAIYTGIIYLILEKTQGKELKSHKENNGEFYSAWKAAKIGAISMIAILFTIFSVAFIAGDLSKSNPDLDSDPYTKEISQFFENETSSLKVLQNLDSDDKDYLLIEVKKSISLWKENKAIINNISRIENLPIELSVNIDKLKKYCDLRIEHFEFISKSLVEGNNKYFYEIRIVGIEIEEIINEMN